MNSVEYIKRLERGLRKLKPVEREEFLQDYRDHFQEGLRQGKTEDEISRGLGNPDKIARLILAEYNIKALDEKPKSRSVFTAIMSIIGLGFFNLIVTLPFFIVLYVVVFAVFAVAAAFVVFPIFYYYFPENVILPFSNLNQELLFVFGIMLIGIGIFLFSGKILKGVFKITVAFLKWNLKVIKGE
ncbi:hypothetical protein AT15_01990 [Kosmotoga arenicorallina S304]|uniref:DUF1700 domain-containing protein n=1 Tax=Kosmotoga arenicorallina S304 TaxID=1453497 RepID=A0A176JZG1_9BACT|nr:DUF1700 domain-containing protein [Kosmotoga arenicorallina]OAA29467.1 hypothetical protein AT15_01990 [Kosmotoga arenicorallina S304]